MLIVLSFSSAITEYCVVYSLSFFPWRQIEFSPGPFLWSLRVFLILAKEVFPESICFALSYLRCELRSSFFSGAQFRIKKEFALRRDPVVFRSNACFPGAYSYAIAVFWSAIMSMSGTFTCFLKELIIIFSASFRVEESAIMFS